MLTFRQGASPVKHALVVFRGPIGAAGRSAPLRLLLLELRAALWGRPVVSLELRGHDL